MKRHLGFVLIVLASFCAVMLLASCSSPEKDAAKAEFDEQVTIVKSKISDLSSLVGQANDLVASEDKALDESLRTSLEVAAADCQVAIDNTSIPSMKSSVDEINSQTEELKKVDFSSDTAKLNSAIKAFQDSQAQYKLVDNPTREYVISCVGRVSGLDNISYITEENDPDNYIGKSGWYYEKIVFHSVNVEHYGYDHGLLTLEQIGNPAGGCVECFKTVEDAERRDAEMKSKEGTASHPGTHKVIGTCLVRTSDNLTASQQRELETALVTELTRLS